MTGIALEGGAERCAFTAGVIKALLENGFVPHMAAGTSAGALCAFHLKAGQKDNALTMAVADASQRYFGLGQFFRCGHFLNLEKMTQLCQKNTNLTSYFQSSIRCEYVAACCENGKPAYLQDGQTPEQLFPAVQASCALPIVCNPITIGGKHYVDGSIVDPVPFSHLLEQGCQKVIAVLTGPKGCHPTDYTPFRPLLYLLYHKKYSALYHALLHRISCYQSQMKKLEQAQREGKVFVLRPQIKQIPLFTGDGALIRNYYQHGINLVNQSWQKIAAWLSEENISASALKV